MRYFIALAALCASPAFAQSTQVETCWSTQITVEPVDFSPAVVEDRAVFAQITNGTDVALSAVGVDFELWSSDRPLALYSGPIRPANDIAGGLLPGENMVARDVHFMDAREKELASAATELSVRFVVNSAKDIDGNALACPE